MARYRFGGKQILSSVLFTTCIWLFLTSFLYRLGWFKVLWGFLPESQAMPFPAENYGLILILLIYMGVVGRLILPMQGVLSYFLELVTDWLAFGVLYRFLLGF